MNYERQKRLVGRLLEKTRAGELAWRESADTDAFLISFSHHSVQLSFKETNQTVIMQIDIIDGDGAIVESFDDEDLSKDGSPSGTSWYSIMNEIFSMARRKALGADEALDSILAEIS